MNRPDYSGTRNGDVPVLTSGVPQCAAECELSCRKTELGQAAKQRILVSAIYEESGILASSNSGTEK